MSSGQANKDGMSSNNNGPSTSFLTVIVPIALLLVLANICRMSFLYRSVARQREEHHTPAPDTNDTNGSSRWNLRFNGVDRSTDTNTNECKKEDRVKYIKDNIITVVRVKNRLHDTTALYELGCCYDFF